MGQGLPGRQLCTGEKGGAGVGKTKRGKGTKVMMVADGAGLPIGLQLTSASPHEVTLAVSTLDTVRVPRRRGRPRQRPRELVADKAYDSKQFRQWLRRRGIKPTIPPNKRRPRRRPKRGRPIVAGPGYRERWKVERTFAWCGNFRRLLVRHERYLATFRAFFLIAFIIISLRHF
jgi:transposase